MKKQRDKKILYEAYLQEQQKYNEIFPEEEKNHSIIRKFLSVIIGSFRIILILIITVLAIIGAIALYHPEMRRILLDFIA